MMRECKKTRRVLHAGQGSGRKTQSWKEEMS